MITILVNRDIRTEVTKVKIIFNYSPHVFILLL